MVNRIFLTLWAISSACFAETELIGGDMHFHGTITALACSVKPGGDRIAVDFGEIATQELYGAGRSAPKNFTIELTDCNPEIFRTVSVTFSGTEDPALPGYVALSSGSQASGIGIGISEEDGTPVRLNQSSSGQDITKGDMSLQFQAWVEAEPDAKKNKTLSYGNFSASGTWTLNYQ